MTHFDPPVGARVAGSLAILAAAAVLAWPSDARATVLAQDATWSGEVVLREDVVVPEGRVLRVAAGTRVRIAASGQTRTEPEYLSPLTEVTVRGTLVVEGTPESPVTFVGAADGAADGAAGTAAGGARPGWAGILVDGGAVRAASARIEGAETGIWVNGGTVALDACELRGGRYGLAVVGPGGAVSMRGGAVTGNEYGAVVVPAEKVDVPRSIVRGNRRADWLDLALASAVPLPEPPPALAGPRVAREVFDDVILGERVWSGRILVRGVVRVPEGSRLVVVPGTVVEFARRDTNADGIGENGILVQGVIVAKGTRASPIVFRSAEQPGRPGDWDAINVMSSDGALNLFEHCVFVNAYRGLHFHFSNVVVAGSRFLDGFRAIQFQESRVELRDNVVAGNRSGIQGRDSRIEMEGNVVAGNVLGAHFFRAAVTARGNTFSGNLGEGLRLRECTAGVTGNVIHGNRFGLTLNAVPGGEVRGNQIDRNGETGIAVRDSDNLEIAGNFVASNGVTGAGLRDSAATVTGNLFSGNGERALGLSGFGGSVGRNTFAGNGRWAIDLDDAADVDAPGNWWGPAGAAAACLDRDDDPARGRVLAGAPAASPVPFAWPLPRVLGEVAWDGTVVVDGSVAVPPGASLSIRPGARVEFGPGAGLAVEGRIRAVGEPSREVVLTSRGPPGPGAWDEVRVERAGGSAFRHCVVEHATWGIHSHFTDLEVADCSFRRNSGGIRFRSGPVRIERCRFEDNGVAIRSYMGVGEIAGCRLTGNDVGIFVREKAGGLRVRGNDIFGNRGWAVRLGDFNDEDLDAAGNWWGPGDPAGAIHDDRAEPGVGTVRLEPVLKAAVTK